jgi:hypothetical protein
MEFALTFGRGMADFTLCKDDPARLHPADDRGVRPGPGQDATNFTQRFYRFSWP